MAQKVENGYIHVPKLNIFHEFIKLENSTTSYNSEITNRQIQYQLVFSNQILRKAESKKKQKT